MQEAILLLANGTFDVYAAASTSGTAGRTKNPAPIDTVSGFFRELDGSDFMVDNSLADVKATHVLVCYTEAGQGKRLVSDVHGEWIVVGQRSTTALGQTVTRIFLRRST